MKRTFLFFILPIALFAFLLVHTTSCTKTNTVTKTVIDTVIKTVVDTVQVSPHSILYYLTQRQWYFDTLVINYTGPGTGSLYYARGSSSNVANFDSTHYVYWRKGTEDAFTDNGTQWYSQTWQFNDPDSTTLYYPPVTPRPLAVYQRILQLDSINLIVYDSTSSAYYHMVNNH